MNGSSLAYFSLFVGIQVEWSEQIDIQSSDLAEDSPVGGIVVSRRQRGKEAELGTARKQPHQVVSATLEPATSRSQNQRLNHTSTPPPDENVFLFVSMSVCVHCCTPFCF